MDGKLVHYHPCSFLFHVHDGIGSNLETFKVLCSKSLGDEKHTTTFPEADQYTPRIDRGTRALLSIGPTCSRIRNILLSLFLSLCKLRRFPSPRPVVGRTKLHRPKLVQRAVQIWNHNKTSTVLTNFLNHGLNHRPSLG